MEPGVSQSMDAATGRRRDDGGGIGRTRSAATLARGSIGERAEQTTSFLTATS